MELGGEIVSAETGEDADRCISSRNAEGVLMISSDKESSDGKSSHVKERPRWRREAGRGNEADGKGKPALRGVDVVKL